MAKTDETEATVVPRLIGRRWRGAAATVLGGAVLALVLAGPGRLIAATNQAIDPGGGSVSLAPSGLLTVNAVNAAVTAAVAEIGPTAVAIGSAGNVFVHDVLPTIGAGDTGVDRVAVTAPAGYANLSVTGVARGGIAQSPNCPAPGPGQYCATVAGQVVTVTLGSKVTVSLTNVGITFTADAPASLGTGTFASTVDDSATAGGPQPTSAGDADGDPTDANSLTVDVIPAVSAGTSTVTVSPAIVPADGVSAGTITTTLRDGASQPVANKPVSYASGRGAADAITQPASPTDAGGVAVGTVRSLVPGVATITATDTADNVTLSATPQVFFTQGVVLDLVKTANKGETVVGGVVTYQIEIGNRTTADVTQVTVDDRVPPNFKYLKGSARLNGQAMPDPGGNRTLTFALGTVPALVDGNANGRADPGEQGYVAVSYQLVVGSGAVPGEYANTAVAKDACDLCLISNVDDAKVSVTLDPVFDLGTIIGKVFEDTDRNGLQDRGEPGVASAMVVLDDGTYVLTDEHGRYHFPAVRPGQRLVKINLRDVMDGAMATTDETLVLSVTPGLLAKANFGVLHLQNVSETIGRPGVLGLLMMGEEGQEPIEVVGSVEALTVLINGRRAPVPTNNVRMGLERFEEIVDMKGDLLDHDVEFQVAVDHPGDVSGWSLTVMDAQGEPVRIMRGEGGPPPAVSWDGQTDQHAPVRGGEIYQYQMDVRYRDGSRAASARRMFGVNRTTAIALSLTGGVFQTGSAELGPEGRNALKDAAKTLRRFPKEKVMIEGHTDSMGSAKANVDLSRKRAQAAVEYLIREEQLPPERFTVRGYGASRPIASNRFAEGRSLNRRVEVKGEVHEVERSKLLDQFRTDPVVSINGAAVPVDRQGRFSARVNGDGVDGFEIEMADARGRSARTVVALPRLDIAEPIGEIRLPYGAEGDGYRALRPSGSGRGDARETAVVYRLKGKSDPGNTVELDGNPLTVDADGAFASDLELRLGDNRFGILVRNAAGYSRIAVLSVAVSDRNENGEYMLAVDPVPNLTVQLPPPGVPLKSPLLTLSGSTDHGNRVVVNGESVAVASDGRFVATRTLPLGKSRVRVQVTDPNGHTGVIEREVEVTNTQLFFLGLADGKFGQLRGKGYLKGAGMNAPKEFYTEGRAAYYLKGVIAGRYLITSAFDSGTHSFGRLFKDLDQAEQDRLLTNLDPDTLYPVYGDSSTIVYDVQSQGKFYLALDGETVHLLMGDYPLRLGDTELAAYQRTLYGARATYQSASRTRDGRPDTELLVFGAEVRQAHVRDELRATGGSLYYVSHRDLIEGSEQVTLVVRDKNTGLPLARTVQVVNRDYTIRYPEGRILFNRPIGSVVDGGSLIDAGLLSGHPVFIQVDYETSVPSFEKTALGGRARRQLGERVTVGATYVNDELSAGAYQLTGVDAEFRPSPNSRLVGEFAKSSGTDSLAFLSEDGGLSFREVTPNGLKEGGAWKLAGELDAGEWIGAPSRVRVGGYLKRLESGFLSSGTFFDQGSQKSGVHVTVRPTERDRVVSRYDRDDTIGPAAGDSHLGTVQWTHDRERWGLDAEYQAASSRDSLGNTERSGYGALRLRADLTKTLTASLEQQQTVAGRDNDQTTLDLRYQLLPALALQGRGTRGTLGQAAQAGAILDWGEGRIYLTERLAEDRAGRNTVTILGGERPLGPSGKVYSEYQWEQTDAGNRTISLIGSQRSWDVISGLRFLLSAEHGRIDSGSATSRRDTLAAGLSYAKAGWNAMTRGEMRREHGASERVQYLSVNRLELKLNPDFTALGMYRYSVTRDRASGRIEAEFEERSIGLAYRPVAHDRLNALARYTRLSDQRPVPAGATEADATSADVASVEWSLQLTRSLEWVDKEAAKVAMERSGNRPAVKTHTVLSIHRLNVRLWKALDLGAEYRMLRQREARDHREGWLTELTWEAVNHLRLGVGFNFTDFSDNEFSNNDYSSFGWFVRLQGRY